MTKSKGILSHCLYFTANSLARIITRMAEEEFRHTGLSPSHAYLLMVAFDYPGIAQKELCGLLHLAPSTVTRFIDRLVFKGYLVRKSDGKISRIYPTKNGEELQQAIRESWDSLHSRYANIIGWEEGDGLAKKINQVSKWLQMCEFGEDSHCEEILARQKSDCAETTE